MPTFPPISIPTPPQTKTIEDLQRSCERALTQTDAIELAGRCDGGKWISTSLGLELSAETQGRATSALWYVYGAALELTRLAAIDNPIYRDATTTLRALSGFDREHRRQIVFEMTQLNTSRKVELARLKALDNRHFFKLAGSTKESLRTLSGFDLAQREELMSALVELDAIVRQRDHAKQHGRVTRRVSSPHAALAAA